MTRLSPGPPDRPSQSRLEGGSGLQDYVHHRPLTLLRYPRLKLQGLTRAFPNWARNAPYRLNGPIFYRVVTSCHAYVIDVFPHDNIPFCLAISFCVGVIRNESRWKFKSGSFANDRRCQCYHNEESQCHGPRLRRNDPQNLVCQSNVKKL